MTVPLIFDDPRPIKSIWFDGEDAGGYCTVTPGFDVTKIVAYRENGQMDHVPFYAVFDGEHIKARVPAQLVTVIYADPETGGDHNG